MSTTDVSAPQRAHRVAATTSDQAVLEELAAHDEISLLCLVAVNPATPAEVVGRLVGHRAHAVRRAVACRPRLPPLLVDRLLDDPARSVRRAVWRHQEVDLDTVLDRLRRGLTSGGLEARRLRLVQDPAVTRRLLEDPTTFWWAAGGAVDHPTYRTFVRTLPEWQRAFVARTCRFSDRTLVQFARDPARQVQEALGDRSDLDDRRRAVVGRRGGVWATAAVLRGAPDMRLPWRRRFAPHRVVRRVVAERETSRFLMWAWSLGPAWDVGCALARNPRLGPRTARLLAARSPWSVSAELARREDVARIVLHLQLSPQVQLVLAGNPASPAWTIRWLLESTDVFIRGQAIGHPAAPLDEVRRVMSDPTTPSWVVRRAAHHPGLGPDERDASLSWLALGGGIGDPNFDPVTCTGNPDTTVTMTAAYAAEARREGQLSVLWLAREQWVADHQRLGFDVLRVIASDPQWTVRRRAAGFGGLQSLDVLRWDEHPAVAATASRTRGDHAKKEQVETRKLVVGAAKVFAAIAAVAAIAFIGELTADEPGDGSPTADVEELRELPDSMPNTELVAVDDRCTVIGVTVELGRDEADRFALSFTPRGNAERWITFAATPTTPPLTAAHAMASETVTVLVPLDRLAATVIDRRADDDVSVEPLRIDLSRPALITKDCR